MRRLIASLFLMSITCYGCSGGAPDRKETCKVTGQVIIDGKPTESVGVYCHDLNGFDKTDPTVSSTLSGRDGKFEMSTYEKGDGVPPGEYAMTFMWGQYNFKMEYSGPDKLNKRYSDQKNSKFIFKVEPGEEKDLGQIQLTTK